MSWMMEDLVFHQVFSARMHLSHFIESIYLMKLCNQSDILIFYRSKCKKMQRISS